MNRDQFVNKVQQMIGLEDKQKADDGTRIVLSTLSHRLTPEEAKDVEAQLPQDLKNVWNSDTWMVNFLTLSRQYQLKYRRKEEMYSLIDNETHKLDVPVGAEQLATAVFHVLKETISDGEVSDIAAQLPQDIKEVWVAA